MESLAQQSSEMRGKAGSPEWKSDCPAGFGQARQGRGVILPVALGWSARVGGVGW